MNPGMPVLVTRLNFCRVWIALISCIASAGSAEMSKFSLARSGVFGVVKTAVPRCTAHASKSRAGVLTEMKSRWERRFGKAYREARSLAGAQIATLADLRRITLLLALPASFAGSHRAADDPVGR